MSAARSKRRVGDAVDSREWQVDGVVDQVAGAAQNMYGRARSVGRGRVDGAPELAEEAANRLQDAGRARRSTPPIAVGQAVARDGQRRARAVGGCGRGVGGYALAWLVHGRRD